MNTDAADTSTELPWVTLVTPAYNQAEYLAQTIESVLAQDYARLEYIVLDDGSTDDTPAVMALYADRIRCERQTNMGQARSLNRGWRMARGSLVGYLSSDDTLEPRAIRMLVDALAAHPQAMVAYGDFRLMDATGRPFRTVQTEDFDADRLRVDLVCQPGPGALFRRRLLDDCGGWNDSLRQVPDFEFWLRASMIGGFVRVPEVLANYRIHESSASFRPTTPERSVEIVGVMDAHWRGHHGAIVDRSLATAHLIAAKSHVQSGRFVACASHWLQAVQRRPATLVSASAWRMLLSGALRRLTHRLRVHWVRT
jgi:glycosyltransferase involved in cell wall biosynthesis